MVDTSDWVPFTYKDRGVLVHPDIANDVMRLLLHGALQTIVEREHEIGAKLLGHVVQFMKDNNIYCEETIYQTDRVIENALPLIDDLCSAIGFPKDPDDDGPW